MVVVAAALVIVGILVEPTAVVTVAVGGNVDVLSAVVFLVRS